MRFLKLTFAIGLVEYTYSVGDLFFDLMGNYQYNPAMGDGERRILEKHVFIPIYGEDGSPPVAPAEAVETYYRLRKKGSLNHRTRLYPFKEDGMTHYVVLREIITTSLT